MYKHREEDREATCGSPAVGPSSALLGLVQRHRADDVRVSGVDDGEGAHPEVLAAGGAQVHVVSGVVVHARLGQHGVVLNLALPERG